MGPDNQNNLQNNSFGSNMPVMGPQPTPAPQQPVMGVPQPLPDVQPQSMVQPQPVEPQPMGPQPIGQPQPIQPEPVQPEPMLGTQPGIQPLPGAQPVPEQPGMPGSQPMSAPKSKKNLIIIAAIAGVAVIAIVIAIIVILNPGKKPPEPANPFPEPEANIVVPTPELAKSVCEKYNGTLVISEGEEVADDYKEVESRYVCQRYENAQQEGDIQTIASYTANDFMYQVDFVKEDKIDERWTRMKSAITKSGNEILENSDDVIIVHDSMTGAEGVDMETDMVIYKEATVALATYTKDNPLAEEILKELGFVSDEESDDGGSDEGDDEGDDEDNGGSSIQADVQRKDDYAMISTAVYSYMASNNGDINGIVKKSDPAKLSSAKWINDSGKDPDGNKYELKAYSFKQWNDDGAVAPGISDNTNGSQVFIIIGANCGGTDSDGNSIPQADSSARAFAVYGYLKNGYYCVASGSTE